MSRPLGETYDLGANQPVVGRSSGGDPFIAEQRSDALTLADLGKPVPRPRPRPQWPYHGTGTSINMSPIPVLSAKAIPHTTGLQPTSLNGIAPAHWQITSQVK